MMQFSATARRQHETREEAERAVEASIHPIPKGLGDHTSLDGATARDRRLGTPMAYTR